MRNQDDQAKGMPPTREEIGQAMNDVPERGDGTTTHAERCFDDVPDQKEAFAAVFAGIIERTQRVIRREFGGGEGRK